MGRGWGVHGTSEEAGVQGAQERGSEVCQGVSHRESLDTPEADQKPELPHPWSLFRYMSAALQNWLQPCSPCRVFCAGSH